MRLHKRLMLQTLNWLGRDVFRLSFMGDYLVSPRDRTSDQRIELLGSYLLRQHLASILEHCRINCVLDVGANRGQYAQMLREIGYRGRIASFEPVPACVATLRQLARDDPSWIIYPWAVGRQDGTTSINITSNTVFSSLLAPNDYCTRQFGSASDVVRSVEVPLRRLDGIFDEVIGGIEDPRVLLKLDTQGYDLEAFAGLGACATRLLGLQSEMSMIPIYRGMPRLTESFAVYEAAGFEVTGMFPVNRDQATARVIEFDCVMVRAAAVTGGATAIAELKPALELVPQPPEPALVS